MRPAHSVKRRVLRKSTSRPAKWVLVMHDHAVVKGLQGAELAQRTGYIPETVRYYEKVGLPPLMRRVSSASRSSIGALSHILMRRRTFRSTARRATDFISSECGIASKYLDRSASTTSA